MKHKLFSNKLWLRVGMLVAIMTTALSGTAWADTAVLPNTQALTTSFTNVGTDSHIQIKTSSANTYTNPLRFYANVTITIQAVTGYAIQSVAYEASSTGNYVTYAQNATVSPNVTPTVSGKVVTWALSDASEFTFKPGNQTRANSITITYKSTGGSQTETIATTTVIDATGITNNDVYTSTEAGSLSASVMADGSAVSGATVTWSSSNNNVATIDSNTGAVTLVGAGIVTFTATYAGSEDYAASQDTYEMTVTSTAPDYATLPFEWEGGASASLLNLAGVTANGLGSDYAEGNAPYLVKFDNTDDYIQVKTDSQPGKVTIDVKMIGGGNTSTINVQESSDGENFTEVQKLTISGSQSSTHSLETSKDFAASTRYVRLSFTKGSNVGVGAITIAKPSNDPVISAENASINYNTTSGSINYEIVHPVEGGTISASTDAAWLTFGSGTAFTATVNDVASARVANVTLTYTYNTSQTVTKEITLTQSGDPNAPGTQNNPYTVAEAIADIEAGTGTEGVCVRGVVSEIVTAYSSQYHNISYNISDDGETTSAQLEVFRGKGINGANFTSENDIQVGDEVVVYGNLTYYSAKDVYEFEEGNYLVSLVRPEKAKHTVSFSVNGVVTSTDEVSEQSAIIFPANPADINGKTFCGWVAEAISGTTDTAPTMVTSATMGTADVTYYAVFADAKAVSSEESLEINSSTEGIPDSYGTANTFDECTLGGVKFQIQQMYKNGEKLQWRAAGNQNGTGTMYNSESLGKINSVILTYESGDSNKNFTLKVGNSANPTDGTDITPTINESVYTFDCSSNECGFFVLTNGDGAGYLTKIVINYLGTSTTYSGYCTTVPASQSVTVSSAGYATIVAKADLEIPENVEVYAVTVGESATSAQLIAVTGGVPAGDAVLVKASEDTYEFPYASATPDAIAKNDLKASDGYVTGASGNIYALGNKTKGVGFYKVAASVTIPAGKAYLEVKTTSSNPESGVKAFYGFEDDATGIEAIDHSPLTIEGAVYNLAGQRLQKMQRGINIVGGKKVMVK